MTTPSLPWFKVMIVPANGGKIAGKRRTLHEVFQAREALVRFQVHEGLVVPCHADGTPIA